MGSGMLSYICPTPLSVSVHRSLYEHDKCLPLIHQNVYTGDRQREEGTWQSLRCNGWGESRIYNATSHGYCPIPIGVEMAAHRMTCAAPLSLLFSDLGAVMCIDIGLDTSSLRKRLHEHFGPLQRAVRVMLLCVWTLSDGFVEC